MAELDKNAAPSLSDAIEKLMANPEIISMVASSLGGMKPSVTAPQPAEEEKNEAEAEPASADGEAVSSGSVMQPQPDLGGLVSSLAPMLSAMRGGAEDKGKQDGKEPCEAKKREALLCALKPYVSDGRREAIDYIIRISEISEMLRHLK